ncbi:MAG: hypothetical protein ACUVV4_05375 [Candidatus Bathyarchaeia archaeon]
MKVSHSFIKAVEEAEKRLSRVLNSTCRINVHNDLDEELMKTIQDIEKEKFSEDLRYMREDLILRKGKKGFICLTLEVEGKSIAFDMGYEDEEGIFFSDDTATLIEGKGIGRTLFALEILYSHELGYKQTKLFTEGIDSEGRPLKDIWGKMGFEVVSKDLNGNLEMRLNHTRQNIELIYLKYISGGNNSTKC